MQVRWFLCMVLGFVVLYAYILWAVGPSQHILGYLYIEQCAG
ncbi:hypothetical protein LCGC14_1543930 [marine sediment metagenome]|uniref:Uncharacterized protein n=1 Tax=marine sediment metagenome TaxID=412755 RepID=A0A0F9JD59_9ZZZZ